MKNIQTFTEFLNEASMLSPKIIKHFDLNKNSVNNLRKYSFKIKDDYLKITGGNFWGDEYPHVIRALWNIKTTRTNNNKQWWSLDTFDISYGDWNGRLCINNAISNIKIDGKSIYIPISEIEIGKLIDKADGDIVEALINFFDTSFEKYNDELEAHLLEMIGLKVLHVIKLGEISSATGKTRHGWSIYDDGNAKLGWDGRRSLLYGGGLEVDKSYRVVDDQKHSIVYSDKFTVKEIIDCNYDDYVAFSKRTGAKVPNQTGGFEYTVYSIK